MTDDPPIESLEVATYRVATDQPESDGTLQWNHTDVIVVQATAGGATGLGWTYAAAATAQLIAGNLRQVVMGRSALAVEGAWQAMRHELRNAGVPGAGSMAIAAVDIALWDLKAKLLDAALIDLWGAVRLSAPSMAAADLPAIPRRGWRSNSADGRPKGSNG